MIKKSIKKLLTISIVGSLLMTSLVACGSSDNNESESKELNLINWSEYIPDEVIQGFEKEYDIKINYTTYSSTGEMLSKVESSASDTYDLIIGGGLPILKEKDLVEKLDKSKLSNLGNLSKTYMNQDFDKGNEYTIPYSIAGTSIAVNTDIVKEEITSYQDLLNSKYKNSIVVVDDARAVIGMGLRACGYDLNSTDDEELEKAKQYLIKLKPNIKLFNGDSPKTPMINGETSIGVIYTAETALAMRENSAIKVVYPKEGIYYGMDSFIVTKDGKNKDLAYKFIDYILRPEVSKIITNVFPYKSPNEKGFDLFSDEYKNNPAANIPESVFEINQPTRDLTSEGQAKWDKIWSEFKSIA